MSRTCSGLSSTATLYVSFQCARPLSRCSACPPPLTTLRTLPPFRRQDLESQVQILKKDVDELEAGRLPAKFAHLAGGVKQPAPAGQAAASAAS